MTISTTPQLKGKGIKYLFGTELTGTNAVVIVGSAPTPRITRATVANAGGVLDGDGLRVQFSPQTAVQLQGNDQAITVTHTPEITPTHAPDGLTTVLTAFDLDATDSAGQTVSQFSSPFTVTINLDQATLDGLGVVNGSTETEEEGIVPTPNIEARPLKWSITLAYWNATQQT